MLISYTTNAFPQDYVPTIFDNYSSCAMVDGRCLQINLWDTAGQDDYDRLRPLSYPQTDAFLLAFAVTSPESFQRAEKKWMPELRFHCPTTPVILVGTKKDLRDDPKINSHLALKGMAPITQEAGEALAKKLGCVTYVECSAYTQEGLREAFQTAMVSVLDDRKQQAKKKKKRTCKIM